MKGLRSPGGIAAAAVLGWFVLAFLIWPSLQVLLETFVSDGELSTGAVDRLLSSDRAIRSLGNSLMLAVGLAVTTNVVGIAIVLITRYFRVRGSRVLWLGYATTLIYGGVVLAAGYDFVYGQGGALGPLITAVVPGLEPDWFSGFGAVLFTMTFATTTNHLLFVSAALRAVDQQAVEAARLMGASHATILWRIVLPTLRPVLFAVTVLSFLTGLGALSAPQVLGGRDFQTIAPIILTFATSPTSRELAALLALLLGLTTIALLAVLARIERGGTYFSIARVATSLERQQLTHRGANAALHVVAYALFVVYTLPVVLIVAFSFVDSRRIEAGSFELDAVTLDNYVRVLTQANALRPFVVSVVYSALAATIVVGGLLLVARAVQRNPGRLASVVEYLLHIPWVLPASLLALGLIISYDHPSPLVGGAVLTGTPVLLLVAYIVAKIPFTLRLLKAAFAAVDGTVEDAARLMGAGTFHTLRRVLLPAVLPTAAAVAALNFNDLLDDYDTSVFLATPLYQPLGPVVQASTQSAQNLDARADTFVYTVMLMLICGTVTWLVYGRATRRTRRVARRAATPTGERVPTGEKAPTGEKVDA